MVGTRAGEGMGSELPSGRTSRGAGGWGWLHNTVSTDTAGGQWLGACSWLGSHSSRNPHVLAHRGLASRTCGSAPPRSPQQNSILTPGAEGGAGPPGRGLGPSGPGCPLRCWPTSNQAGLPPPCGVGNSPEWLAELRDTAAHAHRPNAEAVTQEQLPESCTGRGAGQGAEPHTLW